MFRRRLIPSCLIVSCAIFALSSCPAPANAAPPATKPARPPIIAVFSLSGAMSEQPADEMLPLFGTPGPSLRDVVSRMKKAADDPDVKAIVVLADTAVLGLAQTQELRQAMAKVRSAGKEIYAHSDSLATAQYAL